MEEQQLFYKPRDGAPTNECYDVNFRDLINTIKEEVDKTKSAPFTILHITYLDKQGDFFHGIFDEEYWGLTTSLPKMKDFIKEHSNKNYPMTEVEIYSYKRYLELQCYRNSNKKGLFITGSDYSMNGIWIKVLPFSPYLINRPWHQPFCYSDNVVARKERAKWITLHRKKPLLPSHCDICNTTFTVASSLKKHILSQKHGKKLQQQL